MLPSRGLFKEELCPLFEINDCNRPHCHFRHKKADTNSDFVDYFSSLERALDEIPIQWGPSKQHNRSVKSKYSDDSSVAMGKFNLIESLTSKDGTSAISPSEADSNEDKSNSAKKVSTSVPAILVQAKNYFEKEISVSSKYDVGELKTKSDAKVTSTSVISNATVDSMPLKVKGITVVISNATTDIVPLKSKSTETSVFSNSNTDSLPLTPKGKTTSVLSSAAMDSIQSKPKDDTTSLFSSAVTDSIELKNKTVTSVSKSNTTSSTLSKSIQHAEMPIVKVERDDKIQRDISDDTKATTNDDLKSACNNGDVVMEVKEITSSMLQKQEEVSKAQEPLQVTSEKASSEKKLTKEHLRGIDEIVRLLKKVPERIDFVASFLKSFVQTEDKSKSSTSSSSSSHKKGHSLSSRSHKSSRSSRGSERKRRSDRHRHSSKSDSREHSKGIKHSSEKRKLESITHNGDVIPKKVSRRNSSSEKLPKGIQESSLDEEMDSEDGFEAAPDMDNNVEEEGDPFSKRLSIEEELERLHDTLNDEGKPAALTSLSTGGKRRVAHDTPYISDHKMLRAKVGKSTPLVRQPERITVAPPTEPAPEPPRTSTLFALPCNRPRIGAVPNAQRMLAEKSNITSSAGRSNAPTLTVARSAAPGSKRVEHKTDNNDVLCPIVSSGSNVIPSSVRNLTLKRLYTAMQYYPSKNEARDEALSVEGKIFEKHKDSSKKYHMASVNAIMKAKRGFVMEKPLGPSESEFFERVKNFVLTQEEIFRNGFPIEIEKGYARCFLSEEFKYNKKYRYIKEAFAKGERYCVRCSMTYRVNEETWEQTPIPDVCVFHSDNGKKRVLGEVTHKCCSTPGVGCASESLHITDLKDYDRLPNCVKSESKSPPEKYRRVLALDCEMVHTRLGVELAYVVVVDLNGSVVYESYCKPSREVECYNTAYSGMTEEKLRNVTKTLSTVQKEILKLISDETILVGHSLDSDMRALHIVHESIADTAFLFRVESPDGSFYKRRLKELAQTYLGKIIQESEYGHSAEEDAAAAMALLRHRVLSM